MSNWTWSAVAWEIVWMAVNLTVAFCVAYKFGDRILAHAAGQRRLEEWKHVGASARGRLRVITIQIVTNCLARGMPARAPSLGHGAFEAWAGSLRTVLKRRPDPTRPLSVAELRSEELMRPFVVLGAVAEVMRWFLPRLVSAAQLFSDALPEELRRALSAACLEMDNFVTVAKPITPDMTEEYMTVQVTQNGEAAVRAFESLAALVHALDASVTPEEQSAFDLSRSVR